MESFLEIVQPTPCASQWLISWYSRPPQCGAWRFDNLKTHTHNGVLDSNCDFIKVGIPKSWKQGDLARTSGLKFGAILFRDGEEEMTSITWQCYSELTILCRIFPHSYWIWRISCKILSIPHNTFMDLNNVMRNASCFIISTPCK